MLEFWDNKYGFSFKPLRAFQEEEAMVGNVASHQVITDVALIKKFNLEVQSKKEVEFDSVFDLSMIKEDTLTVSFLGLSYRTVFITYHSLVEFLYLL